MATNDRHFLNLYRAICAAPPTTGSILRARLIAQIQAAGLSVTRLSEALGRGRLFLSRKLNPSHGEARPLTCADLDQITAHLKLDHRDLLEPVLQGQDQLILLAVKDGERFSPTGNLVAGLDPDELPEHLTGDEATISLWRLRAQGLIHVEHVQGSPILALAPLAIHTTT